MRRRCAHALRFRPDVTLSAHIVTSPAAAAIRGVLGARTVQYFHAEEIGAKPQARGVRRAPRRRGDRRQRLHRGADRGDRRAAQAAPDRPASTSADDRAGAASSVRPS